MRTEFLIKTKKGLVDLNAFKNEMNNIMSTQFQNDFKAMDKTMVEVFDKRTGDAKTHPPLKSLGRLPITDVMKKFY